MCIRDRPNIGTRDAKKLKGVRKGEGALDVRTREAVTTASIRGALKIKGAQAQAEESTFEMVEKDKDLGAKLISISAKMERNLLKLSENETAMTAVADTVTVLIGEVTGAVTKINEMIRWLSNRL